MFDTLYIGMSGMDAFSKGLKVISNNLANLNSPGFHSSTLQFTDAYYMQQGASADAGGSSGGQQALFGSGVQTLSTILDLHAGETQQVSNPLDVAISGNGYLVARDKLGAQTYTRDGQLEFNADGDLVSTTTGKYIMGYADGTAGGSDLSRISLDNLRTNAAHATSSVNFTGNLTTSNGSGTTTTSPTATFAVIDGAGGQHSLVATFTRSTTPAATDTWSVAITDGTTNVGSGSISFISGAPDPSADKVTFTYTPTGRAAFDVTLDFSTDVTAFDTGNLSSLTVARQDGYTAGSISKSTFDSDGKLTLTYSNGQTATGAQLALATFETGRELTPLGASEFTTATPASVQVGRANSGEARSIVAGENEQSNVDLSTEFSNLIVMQRGYQASSNVLSTVNDMLQELFDMRGGK